MAKKPNKRELGISKSGKAVFEAYCGQCEIDFITGKTFCVCGKEAKD